MRRAPRRVHWVMLGLAGSAASVAAEPGTPPLAASAPLVARNAVPPRFPLSLRGTEHTAGYATVALTVEEYGRVDDVVTLETSHEAFAAAAESALLQWRFEPAPARTRPPRDVRQFEFRSAGVVDTLSHAEAAHLALAPAPVRPRLRTVSWNDLPEPPRALVHPAPKLSVAAAERLTRRPVVVSFVIDAKGVARVPVVDASIDEETALAVVDAVRQWRFAPPRHDGQPVVVQVSRAFGGTEVHR